jgi:two-component system OmpR family sensor kinase
MSSNRRAEPTLSRKSLRTRLIAEQLTLLALVCLVIGVATVLALRAFLLDQLDSQLSEASMRGRVFSENQIRPSPPLPPINAPGQQVGTITVLVSRTGMVSGATRLAPKTGFGEQLGDRQIAALRSVPLDGNAYNRNLGELDLYRVIAVRTIQGDVIITGLPLAEVNQILVTAGVILGAVSLTGLIAAGLIGALIIRRTLRPLNRVAATASRVAELPLDRGEVALLLRVPAEDTDPRTEVGQVGSALNRMLGHIGNALNARHASETRVRQFVADASHELRTPLSAIRGYAELAKRHEDVPPEVAHAINRVESASRRMTTLVEDLLLLARLDSGRPLDREPVDLSRLVLDTVGDARVSGPEHLWRLNLPAEPVYALGDQQRLHQVLGNLLSNAYTHTPSGSTVTTSLSIVDGYAELAVTDDGPGIPAAQQSEVFERFARGDSSRSRVAGSTGLGLSIVAAVVHAHGGTVHLTSAPGETRFTVRLPATNAPS